MLLDLYLGRELTYLGNEIEIEVVKVVGVD